MRKKSNRPYVRPLTAKEWRELAENEDVRELWGIEDGEEGEFRDRCFAAKFDYQSDGPGYAGDLFVLLGGAPECRPVVLIRRQGKLEAMDSSAY